MGTSDSIKYSGKEGEDIIQDYFFFSFFLSFFFICIDSIKRICIFHFVTLLTRVILLSVAIDSGIEESSLDKLF